MVWSVCKSRAGAAPKRLLDLANTQASNSTEPLENQSSATQAEGAAQRLPKIRFGQQS